MKRITCLGVLTALCLSGCAGQVNETVSTSDALPNPQLQALVQAEAAGLLESNSQEPEEKKAPPVTAGNAEAAPPVEKDLEPSPVEEKDLSAEVKPEPSASEAGGEPTEDVEEVKPSESEGQTEPSEPEVQVEPTKPEVQAEPSEPEVKVELSEPQVQSKLVAAESTAEPADGLEPVQPSEPEQPEPEEADDITEAEALGSVKEPFDMAHYTIEMTDIQLEISPPDSSEVHKFYVFVVKDDAGEEVGQIAVDRETGEKYTYKGEGIIEDYSVFPLYEPQHGDYDWEGEYESPSGLSLVITGREDDGFTYEFSDGTGGYANITGDTAKSEDGEINFLLSEKIITVAGGGLTGNYDVAT